MSVTAARVETMHQLLVLAHGLEPDEEGRLRLLERVAAQDGDEASRLRALLIEQGAARLLAQAARVPA